MGKYAVCLINDSFPPIIDGVANAVVNYAFNIEKQHGHAIVVTPEYPGADDSEYSFPVIRYPSFDTRKKTSGYVTGFPWSPELTGKITSHKIDIIHAHCPMISAYLGRVVRRYINAPMIMTYHTKYDIDIANVVNGKALQTVGIKAFMNNVTAYDEIWTVSRGAGENLKSLGYEGDYIVMPNGVDLDRHTASDAFVKLETSDYDLPDGVPVFLFVGRLMWYKGLKITLDALRMLKEKNIDFRMVIVGNGGDGEEIRDYAGKLGLDDKVFFTGSISDRERIRAWYTRADLFLFPSTFDSNGLVVREAAACDLPSVLINGSCAAEGVKDCTNAFLIEENAQSMFKLLERVSQDMSFVRQIGHNAGEELYMSWESAVAMAQERYGVVMELYKSGAYEEHVRTSDNLLAASGDLMYTLARLSRAIDMRKSNTISYDRSVDNSRKIVSSNGQKKRQHTKKQYTKKQQRLEPEQ